MFTAYLDESGQETLDWTFVAGFLGDKNQWNEFVPKWRDALGPQRKFLHMSDLRWNRDRTKMLLARLGKIPDECKLTPVLSGVRFGDYEDMVTGSPEEKALKGYMACVIPLVLQILRVIPDGERLELIFEQQTRYQFYANQALNTILKINHPWVKMRNGRPKLAGVGFCPEG